MHPSPSSPPEPDPSLSPPSSWLPDSVIEGRFQIIRELGHGGMGAVYLVFDREFCRELALKRIHPRGVGQEDHEERFRREYRALAAIRDPGVPQLHHSGKCADGAAWFTMEAIRGEPLRGILDRDTLGPARALDLAIKLGKILAAAHDAGVIHRDVKPANIMVEPGDRVRLLDFGVCTPLPRFLRAAEPRRRTADVDRWQSGEDNFAGTVGYSDPVTYDGTAATVRSDIYSLAVILYEMSTGRRHCDPDSLAYRNIDSAEFPVALAALADDLRRAVSHYPFERHRTMAELVQRLEIARGLLARANAEAGPSRPRPRVPPLLLGLALGIGAAALAVTVRDRAPPAARRAELQPAAEPPPAHASDARPETAPGTASAVPDPAAGRPAAPVVAPAMPDPADGRPDAPTAPTPPPTSSSSTPPGKKPPASSTPPGKKPPASGYPQLAAARNKLARFTPVIARCFKDFGTSLKKRVDVVLALNPAGHVQATTPARSSDLVATCIATALTNLSFAPGTPSPLNHTFDLTAP